MTLFEYISIGTSLILSFSLARTLTNLAPIFSPGRRYWVHGTWVMGLLVYHATLFWQLWLYQAVDTWTFVEFVLFLTGPIFLLVGVSLLVPIEAVADYRVYFESIRSPFYCVLVVMQIQPILLLYLSFDIPFAIEPPVLGGLVFAVAAIVGLVGRSRSIDMALVCFFIFGIIGGLFTINDHESMMDSVRSLMH